MDSLKLKCSHENLMTIKLDSRVGSTINPNGIDVGVYYGHEILEAVFLSENDAIKLYQFLKEHYGGGE